ncbi:winged helix DNA-binding domain-containing protein [Streptomyces luteolus]|uniref:Winged helix DNA-binding domain-containing protein n=1 Tax=Streptomyces luteolus TaxID=3043615 RepID=A0ABT6T7F7_9ACTN|nr:winged helix DNA-binding domain-containing protein [Streptomyces sp. B-S-A12]MDI3423832.1 winged helix DNA-binding domain-containing protein [Streptomyces sp. B-S-A12]
MATIRPKISDRQRRAMLVHRHLLAPSARATSVEQVADALVALHATEPATVFLSVAARMTGATPQAVEQALYEDQSLVRMLCMRRTVFVVPKALASVVEASTARTVAARERGALAKVLADQLGHDAAWLQAVERDLITALADLGEADATQIADAVPQLKERITFSPGKPYETRARISNKVLTVMAAEGRIRRGRPQGTWASAKFRWTLAEPHAQVPADHARIVLATCYLTAFGPVTLDDIKWWTGWNLTHTLNALAGTGAVEVDLGHATGYVLPDDPVLGPPDRADSGPAVSLLPSLDPTAMGWRDRDWYLDPAHVPELFDRNGNICPTLWCDGRIIGGWGQHEDGRIVTHLLTTETDRRVRTAIAAEAARLTEFLGEVRIRPRLRTPLVRRLSG